MPATGNTFEPLTDEEIALPNWLSDPEAKRILVSCAFNPPKFITEREANVRDPQEWIVATGRRADRLRAIRQEYGKRALQYGYDTGNYAPMDAWCLQVPTADAAIIAMLSAAPWMRSVKVARPVVVEHEQVAA